MALLQVENLSVAFESRGYREEAVSGVSFEIEPGQITGIVGESGCGKTTLMRALAGLLPDDASVACDLILLGGEEMTPPAVGVYRPKDKAGKDSGEGKRKRLERKRYQKKMEEMRGKHLAMIFQEPSLYLDDSVTIGRQLMDTVRAHRSCSKKEAAKRAEELLDLVGMPSPKEQMKKYSFELSGGMCQRAAIAISLASEPELIIADEPTTALDVLVQGQILELMRRIVKRTKAAILLVSHDLGVIAAVCTRVLVMNDGRIVESGTVEDVFYLPEQPYTKSLMEAANQGISPRSIPCETAAWPYGVPLGMAPAKEQGETILEIRHVSRDFGDLEAVQDVSFAIREGEIFGLVGESGCGKTTLAKMVAGLLKPDEGEILYEGNKITVSGKWKKKRMPGDIQMVFQNPAFALSPMLTVGGQLEDALLSSGMAKKDKCRALIWDMLKLVGLTAEDAKKYPREFSGGQKQRLVIARALLLRPKLIVCDEPVSALDFSIREQILNLLVSIQGGRPFSCLLISHDLYVIKDRSQRVGVMYQGRLVEIGPTLEVIKEPWHPYTKALLEAALVPDPFRARKKKPAMWLPERKNDAKEGCPFVGQCSYATERCRRARPGTYRYGERMAACFLYSEEAKGKRSADYVMRTQI
ncbi:ABC transporter ATP-binding protein [Roseburia hominis]